MAGASALARDAQVRRVQVANHQADDPPEFVGRAGPRHARAVSLARGLPVDAVELRVEEVVAQQRPRLVEHLLLLGREVHRQFGRHVERARIAPLDGRDLHAAGVEEIDLAAVGRELRVRLSPRRRRQLARDRPLGGQLVERVRVQVRLPADSRDDGRRLAVRTDRDVVHIEADRDERQALADVLEHGVRRSRRIVGPAGPGGRRGHGPVRQVPVGGGGAGRRLLRRRRTRRAEQSRGTDPRGTSASCGVRSTRASWPFSVRWRVSKSRRRPSGSTRSSWRRRWPGNSPACAGRRHRPARVRRW